jgi:hypothetical protein
MAFGLFGEYIFDSEDENYPTWPCLNKKDDGFICRKRYFHEGGCVKHYKSSPNKMCASYNGPIHSQTGFCMTYKKNWLESHKKSK